VADIEPQVSEASKERARIAGQRVQVAVVNALCKHRSERDFEYC
jgi:hypothetical protein